MDIGQQITDISQLTQVIEGPTAVFTGSAELSIIYNPEIECGNSIPEPGEECDDGADGNDTNLCMDDCTFTFCGDSIVQFPNGQGTGGPFLDGFEHCDDGANGIDTDDCFDNCSSTQICGDGDIRGTEECDDGNVIANDRCTSICLDAICGDGFVWNIDCSGPECEECDNGSLLNSDIFPDV